MSLEHLVVGNELHVSSMIIRDLVLNCKQGCVSMADSHSFLAEYLKVRWGGAQEPNNEGGIH